MKLYVDDQRPAPPGWRLARNVKEAISILMGQLEGISRLSLDHDLAPEHYLRDYSRGETGFDVLVWIEEKLKSDPDYLPPAIFIHSMSEEIGRMERKREEIMKEADKRVRWRTI